MFLQEHNVYFWSAFAIGSPEWGVDLQKQVQARWRCVPSGTLLQSVSWPCSQRVVRQKCS